MNLARKTKPGIEDKVFPEEDAAWKLKFTEGPVKTIKVVAYERDKAARQACISYHGCICVVCDFDFEKVYGPLGHDFIHVHHVVPISMHEGRPYELDPLKDLCPVCPNCHAMLHRGEEVMGVGELRGVVRRGR